MAQESKDKQREIDEDDASAGEGSSEIMRAADETLAKTDGDDADDEGGDVDAGDDDEDEQAAAQLGTDRYVLAGFFAAGMLGAYVLGRAIQSLWSWAGNRTWLIQRVPVIASVSDEDKGTYGILLGGLIALVVVYRAYQRSDVRAWSDGVASELAKVVWPSRKEVTNSTFIVIVASAMATVYLALLDRLWAFVTNIVYGDGS